MVQTSLHYFVYKTLFTTSHSIIPAFLPLPFSNIFLTVHAIFLLHIFELPGTFILTHLGGQTVFFLLTFRGPLLTYMRIFFSLHLISCSYPRLINHDVIADLTHGFLLTLTENAGFSLKLKPLREDHVSLARSNTREFICTTHVAVSPPSLLRRSIALHLSALPSPPSGLTRGGRSGPE